MKKLVSIDQVDRLKAVADERRLEVLRLLLAQPRTLTQLAELTGTYAAKVRHHVKVLESAGLICVAESRTTRNYTEHYYEASAAALSFSLFVRPDARNPADTKNLFGLVSDDFIVEALVADEKLGFTFSVATTGSLDGLIGLRQGWADIAGCHLLDVDTNGYNTEYIKRIFPDRDVHVVTLADREQGLMVARGNPLDILSVEGAIADRVRFVNRNRGSGTRLWLDRTITRLGCQPEDVVGYDHEVTTHRGAARAVAGGAADVGIGVSAAAAEFGLDFIPLHMERYELVIASEVFDTEPVEKLLDRLHSRGFKKGVSQIRGYDTAGMGDERLVTV